MEVTVQYIGHIDERKRPENFPHEVSNVGSYKVTNPDQLKQVINAELGAIIQNQGMIVQLDPAQVFDTRKVNIRDRVYVPLHMITHLEAIVSPMAPMPVVAETGILDAEGKPVTQFETPEGKKILPS